MGRIVIGGLVILAVLFGLKQFSQMQSSELITFISHGDEVDITASLPSEGYAVVEFTADW